jgi:type II secretory pathway pseudopilin PulG
LKPRSPRAAGRGFALVEVLLSIIVLGLTAAAVGQAFTSAHAAVAARLERAQIDSVLRSLMEVLLATSFDNLAGGTQNVSVCGQSLTLSWTVAGADLNGDATPEASARLITATLGGRTLRCIVTDHTGPARPIKIP